MAGGAFRAPRLTVRPGADPKRLTPKPREASMQVLLGGRMTIARRTLALLAAAMLLSVAAPLPAAAGRAKSLKFPRFSVPPRSDREVCMLIKLPRKKAMDIGGSIIVNIGGNENFTSHHFLMWVYTGSNLDSFPPEKSIRDSKACIDFGPQDTNQRVLIAGSQVPRYKAQLPRGLAQKLDPVVGSDQKPQGIA